MEIAMNKITTFLTIVILTLSIIVVATMQSKAQSKALNITFAGIMPFVTNNDRLGFFNQNNGRVYIYDNNINQCLFVGQMTEIGKPIQSVTSGNDNVTNPAAL